MVETSWRPNAGRILSPNYALRRTGSFGAYEDEEDWIQVEECDGILEEFGPNPSRLQNRYEAPTLSLPTPVKESYYFSRSGAIQFPGVDGKIRDSGMESSEKAGSTRLSMTDRLVLMEKLGEGASGRVYKGFDLQELRLVAIKCVPIADRGKRRQMLHELRALRDSLARPLDDVECADGRRHVVALYDAFSRVPEVSVSLMVEYMDGGSLQHLVDKGGLGNERVIANLALQAVRGLSYLHATNHVHRDLKPANMLINHRGVLKISDFGTVRQLDTLKDTDSRYSCGQALVGANTGESGLGASLSKKTAGRLGGPILEEDDPAIAAAAEKKTQHTNDTPAAAAAAAAAQKNLPRPRGKLRSFVGTVFYMSPERINGECYSTPADVWALGLSVMALAAGRVPRQEVDGYWSLLQSIRDEPAPSLPPESPTTRWSVEFRDFLDRCLAKDPSGRYTAAQLRSHAFFHTVAPCAAWWLPLASLADASRGWDRGTYDARFVSAERRRNDDDTAARLAPESSSLHGDDPVTPTTRRNPSSSAESLHGDAHRVLADRHGATVRELARVELLNVLVALADHLRALAARGVRLISPFKAATSPCRPPQNGAVGICQSLGEQIKLLLDQPQLAGMADQLDLSLNEVEAFVDAFATAVSNGVPA